MKRIAKYFKQESGQALVIVAVSLVVLLGVTAFAVDLGGAFNAKAKLQAAADAAALAGAQDIPDYNSNPAYMDYTTAKNTAISYANKNGVASSNVTPTAPYAGDWKQIEVVCKQNYNYLFARIFGVDSKEIVVRAVAERRLIWGGETLPFLNIDDSYTTGDPIVLWEKTDTGDFEQLLNRNNHPEYEFTYDTGTKQGNAINCMLDGLDDGAVDIRNGLNNSIDPEVTNLCALWQQREFVYVLSLANIPTDPLNYVNAKTIKEGGNITGASISLGDIVLLKCRITSYVLDKSANNRGIVLEYLGESINLGEAIANETYIPGFVNHGIKIQLVE